MQEYRAYLIRPDGYVTHRIDLICDDGNAAKERAKQLAHGHNVELWQLDRKIATLPQKQ
jgi:hypothetical protein